MASGLWSSLSEALPYAIPAIAGAVAGGPAVGMMGAAGGAEAAQSNLRGQIGVANAMAQNRFRNQELGLRWQQLIQTGKLRDEEMQATQLYRQNLLDLRNRGLLDRETQTKHNNSYRNAMLNSTLAYRDALMRRVDATPGGSKSDPRRQLALKYLDNYASYLRGSGASTAAALGEPVASRDEYLARIDPNAPEIVDEYLASLRSPMAAAGGPSPAGSAVSPSEKLRRALVRPGAEEPLRRASAAKSAAPTGAVAKADGLSDGRYVLKDGRAVEVRGGYAYPVK